jgi:23S rRNA (uracil1939-C5)-methyltransferase
VKLRLDSLAFGGDAVGRADGRVVFVARGAPGDLVEVEIAERHRNWDRGEIARLVDPGPDRVQPPCPYFGECGGCQWQHVSYPAQLAAKQRILRSALRRLAPEVTVDPAEAPFHYRRRVKVHFADGRVGFLARRSHRLVPIDRCLLLEPSLMDLLDRERPRLRGRGAVELCAREDLADPGEPALRVAPGVFAQVGDAADRALRRAVLDQVRGPRVLELFAGAGNFTRLLVRAAEVTAVEDDARALDLLRENAPPARAVRSRAEDALRDLLAAGERFDTVLLDPPRRGAPELIGDLSRLDPARIVYVSCDPMTLARDAERLVARGRHVVWARGFDLMPQTFHIEAILVLEGAGS